MLHLGLGALVAALATGCQSAPLDDDALATEQSGHDERGRLRTRHAVPAEQGPLGLQPLGLGGERDGLLYVPQSYKAEQPAPLLLMLHGAGGEAEEGIASLQA